MSTDRSHARRLDEDAVLHWPLPSVDDDGDKNERGRVLIIAGSREMPGAAVLAATAALRAGAGKLQIATSAGVAALVGLGAPESRVIWLPEDQDGRLDEALVLQRLAPLVAHADAVLMGPGMDEGATTWRIANALLPGTGQPLLVLDAAAMSLVCHREIRFDHPVLLTPHAGEMATLMSVDKRAIDDDPARFAADAARRWNAVVALKGPTTYIATPDGTLWRHDGGHAGLATSGSGDTLAGLITGLAARGASLEQAAAWGVVLHAQAGDELARRVGPIGYLAREMAECVPRLLDRLAKNTHCDG